MAPKDKPSQASATPATPTPEGERIAKVLSRRGVSSRREAERLIADGEVTVNGKVITSPALNVTNRDKITISGYPLPDEEPARLWLYYKPEGLVTSASDEKGRDTVFDHLPEDMPRVMSIGRLDLNSEGLLLLTNDGELKRRLELPSTGWLRKYRVRVNGNPTDPDLEPLRKGITIDGERFQPMLVTLDRHQGANAWLTVGLREGRNREIRRAMNAIDLYVNRLIRVSYGPFRLNDMKPGEVEEVRQKVLREQLGGEGVEEPVEAPKRKLAPRRGAADPSQPLARPGAKPGAASAGRTGRGPNTREGDENISRPRNARPGDGVKALSRAWKEAVTPDAGGRPARPERAGAATTSRSGGKPAPRDEGKPGGRSFGTKPGAKPTGGFGAKPTGRFIDREEAKAAGRGERPTGKPAATGSRSAPRPAAGKSSGGYAERGEGKAEARGERPAGKPSPRSGGSSTGRAPSGASPSGRGPRGSGPAAPTGRGPARPPRRGS